MNPAKPALVALLSLAVFAAAALPAAAAREDLAATNVGPTAVIWQPKLGFERAVLTLSGPHGVTRHEFAGNSVPSLDVFASDGFPLPDGSYSWELRYTPVLSSHVKRAIAEARATGDLSEVEALRAQGALPSESLVQNGYLTVTGGLFVVPSDDEVSGARPSALSAPLAGELADDEVQSMSAADQVFLDDLIVEGSICAGLDCSNGESFGFDTIRLKENNLRIKFQDTSTSASFPSNDWQLTANDSSNGGANKFSIDDIDNSRTPFTVEAAAPSNSLYVDDGGRLGLGTATPVADVHVQSGNTPTLRLEQDGSNGFTPQTWDVAGNEANFFIRDVTNGSALPFRIEPSSPSNALYIEDSGEVGVGTTSPSADLDVVGNLEVNGVSTFNGTTADVVLTLASDAASTRFQVANSTAQAIPVSTWSIGQRQNGRFAIILDGNGGEDELAIDPSTGDVLVDGAVVQTSTRTAKHDIVPVDARSILQKIAALPLAEWTYKSDARGQRHLGPMAEDFWDAFQLGRDSRGITSSDTAGVALAAIQGLNEVVEEKEAEIDELRAENAELAARLAALEQIVQALAAQ